MSLILQIIILMYEYFGIYIWPNSFIGNNYYEEIDFLKTWIKNRTKWLDKSISEL